MVLDDEAMQVEQFSPPFFTLGRFRKLVCEYSSSKLSSQAILLATHERLDEACKETVAFRIGTADVLRYVYVD